METIGHVLLYFVKGSLPWQGLPGRNKDEKYQNIKNKKLETRLEDLCNGVPQEFYDFMAYCRSLQFEEQPNYQYCLGLFRKCLQRHNLDPNVCDYSWKQNFLSKDKQALKNSMLNIIRKKPKMNGEVLRNAGHVPSNLVEAGGGTAVKNSRDAPEHA